VNYIQHFTDRSVKQDMVHKYSLQCLALIMRKYFEHSYGDVVTVPITLCV